MSTSGRKIVAGSSLVVEETEPFREWKAKFESYLTHSHCGLCLYFRSPACTFSGLSDVIKTTDSACASFFPLAERLEVFYRSRRSAKRFMKQVEQL